MSLVFETRDSKQIISFPVPFVKGTGKTGRQLVRKNGTIVCLVTSYLTKTAVQQLLNYEIAINTNLFCALLRRGTVSQKRQAANSNIES